MAPWWSKETACFCGHPRFNLVLCGFYTKEWRNANNHGNNNRQNQVQDNDNNKVREQTRHGNNENTTKEGDARGSWTLMDNSKLVHGKAA